MNQRQLEALVRSLFQKIDGSDFTRVGQIEEIEGFLQGKEFSCHMAGCSFCKKFFPDIISFLKKSNQEEKFNPIIFSKEFFFKHRHFCWICKFRFEINCLLEKMEKMPERSEKIRALEEFVKSEDTKKHLCQCDGCSQEINTLLKKRENTRINFKEIRTADATDSVYAGEIKTLKPSQLVIGKTLDFEALCAVCAFFFQVDIEFFKKEFLAHYQTASKTTYVPVECKLRYENEPGNELKYPPLPFTLVINTYDFEFEIGISCCRKFDKNSQSMKESKELVFRPVLRQINCGEIAGSNESGHCLPASSPGYNR